MKKFYLVYLSSHEKSIPVDGHDHRVQPDNSLSIFDIEGNLSGYFPGGMWQGFTIEHIQPCEHNHDDELPSINQASHSGH